MMILDKQLDAVVVQSTTVLRSSGFETGGHANSCGLFSRGRLTARGHFALGERPERLSAKIREVFRSLHWLQRDDYGQRTRHLPGRQGDLLEPAPTDALNPIAKTQMVTRRDDSSPANAEKRFIDAGLKLLLSPGQFGNCTIQTGNLLFLSAALTPDIRASKWVEPVDAELREKEVRGVAQLAAFNVLAAARQYLGSLDKITRVVRLVISTDDPHDVSELPVIAHAVSVLLQDVLGKDQKPARIVYGVASVALAAPIQLEVIFEVAGGGDSVRVA
jgi:enamine deaminase RidA (YjgF/YER057c/UK114 family)